MSQGTLLSAGSESLANSPAYGMTVDGALFQLRKPEALTNVNAYLFGARLPTPVVNDMGAGKTPEQWQILLDKWKAKHNNNGHGDSLNIEVQKLLIGDSTKPLSEDGKP